MINVYCRPIRSTTRITAWELFVNNKLILRGPWLFAIQDKYLLDTGKLTRDVNFIVEDAG